MTVVHVKMEGAGLALQGSTRIDGLEGMCRAGMGGWRWRETVSSGVDKWMEMEEVEMDMRLKSPSNRDEVGDAQDKSMTQVVIKQEHPRGQTTTINMGSVIYSCIGNTCHHDLISFRLIDNIHAQKNQTMYRSKLDGIYNQGRKPI